MQQDEITRELRRVAPIRKRSKRSPRPVPVVRKKRSEPAFGYVYFAQAGEEGPIKIGFANNVPRRICSLQVGHPEKLRLLAVVKAEATLEVVFHELFKASRLRGEWFAPNIQILRTVAILAMARSVHSSDDMTSQSDRSIRIQNLHLERGHAGECVIDGDRLWSKKWLKKEVRQCLPTSGFTNTDSKTTPRRR
jgi:hypothetical protein